jgi:hypothetical protein
MDGQCFRWRCEFHYPAERASTAWSEGRITSPDRLIVRPENSPHNSLTVSWPPCCGPVVKPAMVRACIEEALRRGWLREHRILDLQGTDVPSG